MKQSRTRSARLLASVVAIFAAAPLIIAAAAAHCAGSCSRASRACHHEKRIDSSPTARQFDANAA